MKKITIVALGLLLINQTLWAQKDTKENSEVKKLSTYRTVFYNRIIENGTILSRREVKNTFGSLNDPRPANKYFVSNVISYTVGPGIALWGLEKTIKTLIGVKKTAVIEDGSIVNYRSRSFKSTLLGLTMIATGVSFLEYACDLKKSAVNIYNKNSKIKNSKNAVGSVNIGLTPSMGMGISLGLN